jgi:3-oxoisoapionate decarboxylase
LITRRDVLSLTAAALLPVSRSSAANEKNSGLGIATTSYMTFQRPKDTLQFLEHCHQLGASGIQSQINGDPAQLRSRAEQLGMFIEAMVVLPKSVNNLDSFELSLKNAKAAGAVAARTQSGTRRYEAFSTLADYQEWRKQTKSSLDAAVPLLEKYKLATGLENHKDRTVDELVALLKGYSSEYLGTCLDFGNNLALLDDPMDVIEKLAPFAVTSHLKDMGVEPWKDGFLLSEVTLGTGILDLPRIISTIWTARPKTNFMLEMITRDPLEIPCLTDRYWATFPDRNGRYLSRTLKLVQSRSNPAKPLPRVSQLSREAQLATEEDNVNACMKYGRQTLGL